MLFRSLSEYTNQIKPEYIKFWQDLGVDDQIAFGKLNENLFRIPNLGKLTTENFDQLVSKKFISELTGWTNIYGWDFTQNRAYLPSLSVDRYDYRLSEKEGNVYMISVLVYKEYIEIQTVYGFQHTYLNTVIKSMFTWIDEQQKSA